MTRTTEKLLKDAEEAIETGELDYTIRLDGTKTVNGQDLVAELSAKLREREWMDIESYDKEMSEEVLLCNLNNENATWFGYWERTCGHFTRSDLGSPTHWQTIALPTQEGAIEDEEVR